MRRTGELGDVYPWFEIVSVVGPSADIFPVQASLVPES